MKMNFAKAALAAAALLLTSTAFSATVSVGPNPYLRAGDSPFKLAFGLPGFYLEHFEDGALNTLGVSASAGQILRDINRTDSVDGDDLVLDGTGRTATSYWSAGSAMTFTFDKAALGSLPVAAGLVVTHTAAVSNFSFFDALDNLLASFDLSVPAVPNGETSADRFIGVISTDGIAKITTTGNHEIDHLQYYAVPTPVPVPAAAWLFASAALGLVGVARRRAG